MTDERRRYFRINETLGVSYRILDAEDHTGSANGQRVPDALAQVTEQDEKLERLLLAVAEDSPKVAELVAIFNQKLERLVHQLMLERNLVNRMAQRLREVNISACGMAFTSDEPVAAGSRLRLELTLFPGEQLVKTEGRVVGCEQAPEGKSYYWRIDFYGMTQAHQEALIQHIVRSQSHQIKQIRAK